MASQYFIQRAGEESGPFGFKELVTFVRDGKLVHSDQVRFSWTHDWQRADSLVGLFHMAQKSSEELAQPEAPPAGTNSDQIGARPPLADELIAAGPDEHADFP